jgi:hypothetical protein
MAIYTTGCYSIPTIITSTVHFHKCCIFIVHYFLHYRVEKNNDDVRTYHLTKSNKWDAHTDILLASKRLQVTGKQKLPESKPRILVDSNK